MEIEESDSVDIKTEQQPSLNPTGPPLASSCCIYRVPLIFRKMNEEAYTPFLVSIGPFHHRSQTLGPMQQDLKLSYLIKFVKRAHQQNSLHDYGDVVRCEEDKIRRCYSEPIPMESDDFVNMILTDACFIIELFVAGFLADSSESNEDAYLLKRWPRADIMRDLILLENQIPFFVLEDLFNLAFPSGLNDGRISFQELTYKNFLSYRSCVYPPTNEYGKRFLLYSYFEEHHLTPPNADGGKQVKHLCDMLRAFYVPTNPPARSSIDPNMTTKCSCTANELNEAGLKFEVHQDKGIFELECSEGVFKMPVIVINAMTEIMLRNVVAFEQCHHYFTNYHVTDYMFLLFNLIKTGKDVEILVEKEIMENILGDNDDVATMIIKLARNTWLAGGSNANYSSLYENLDHFYENPCHKHKENFVRDYWSTPWKRLSLFGGIVILFFTLIQTICSVISLFKGGAQN
ncbi:UPF0481 protein At3g47200-like [Prosopis cineraria]|uniref:UPF0481 protein At3g47200-like n=1 Tax=Prosopis cineraria TaxID=364024 RepID=UPI00240F85D5|nr:UPF0481 protein At3g47200-like [Prosopis cineraria]